MPRGVSGKGNEGVPCKFVETQVRMEPAGLVRRTYRTTQPDIVVQDTEGWADHRCVPWSWRVPRGKGCDTDGQ